MRLPHWTFALFLGLLHCAPLCRAAVKYSLDTSNVLGASMRYLMSDSRNNDTCSQDLEALEEALMKREMWALQSKEFPILHTHLPKYVKLRLLSYFFVSVGISL